MTRRGRIALWSGTLLVSCALILIGVPGARTNAVTAWMIALRLVRATGFDWSIWCIATGSTAIVTGLLIRLLRRSEDPTRVIAKLARRGTPIAAIARRTGLAQDAVRDVLRASPVAAHAAPSAGPRRLGGTLFRRASGAAEPPGPDFGELLRRTASRATT